MEWNDDEAQQFYDAYGSAGRGDAGRRAVASLAVELAAARGGTMTAEDANRVLNLIGNACGFGGDVHRSFERILLAAQTCAAQGAKIASLEEAIRESDAEYSRGRDAVTAQGAKIAALEAEVTRLTERGERLEVALNERTKTYQEAAKERDTWRRAAKDGTRDREAVMAMLSERVRALEQHISDLEKSLENTRRLHREEAESGHRWKREAETWKARAEAEQRSREQHVQVMQKTCNDAARERDAWKSRWSALADRVEATLRERDEAMKERDTIQEESRARMVNLTRAWAAEEEAKKERDEALADNAALLKRGLETCEGCSGTNRVPVGEGPTVGCIVYAPCPACADLREQPHPGAALLEEMKALRIAQAEAEADSYAIHAVLGWAGEWSQGLPAPSRAVAALLERLKRLEEALDGIRKAYNSWTPEMGTRASWNEISYWLDKAGH